jgi:hypothetical protein
MTDAIRTLRTLIHLRVSVGGDGPIEGCSLRQVRVYEEGRRVELYRESHAGLPKMCLAFWHDGQGEVPHKRSFISVHGDGWNAMFVVDVDAGEEIDIIRLHGERAMLRDVVMMRLAG